MRTARRRASEILRDCRAAVLLLTDQLEDQGTIRNPVI